MVGQGREVHGDEEDINIQPSTNNGDHGEWEMEGCAREVRGLGEDGKGGRNTTMEDTTMTTMQ